MVRAAEPATKTHPRTHGSGCITCQQHYTTQPEKQGRYTWHTQTQHRPTKMTRAGVPTQYKQPEGCCTRGSLRLPVTNHNADALKPADLPHAKNPEQPHTNTDALPKPQPHTANLTWGKQDRLQAYLPTSHHSKTASTGVNYTPTISTLAYTRQQSGRKKLASSGRRLPPRKQRFTAPSRLFHLEGGSEVT